MRTTRISVLATRPWRTRSRSRVFRGSIFADKAASTKWSGPPFAFGGFAVGLPASCGYKAGTRLHIVDSSFRSVRRYRVAMFAR